MNGGSPPSIHQVRRRIAHHGKPGAGQKADDRVAALHRLVPIAVLGVLERLLQVSPAILPVVHDVAGEGGDLVDLVDRPSAEAGLFEGVDVAPAILARDRHHRPVGDQ